MTSLILNREALATTPARALVLAIVEEAIEAVLPEVLLPQALSVRDGALHVTGRTVPLPNGVWILGAGKASAGMAAAAENLLGDAVRGGTVVTVRDAAGPKPKRVEVLYGDHPVPGQHSLASTQRLLETPVAPGDAVLWLISGGASALLCAPAMGLTLEEKQEANRLLVRSGATIDQINIVRKHLSAVKGGRLREHFGEASFITLALSDVVSGRLDVIGSGPSVPDSSTYQDALSVIETFSLRDRMPLAVMRHLEAGTAELMARQAHHERDQAARPELVEGRAAGDIATVIGSPARAATAAARSARKLAGESTHVEVLADRLGDEARSVASGLGSIYRYWSRERTGPQVIIAAGEPTVIVRGDGAGGRCQELAAALISEVHGLKGCAVLCAATDGQDFLPGAGGALVDGDTALVARGNGVRVQTYLDRNDTNALHRALGTLIESRPTGTNVCDLVVAVLNYGA